jgi:ATP-dependent Clp protease ATP-binding subunit ClpA
MTKIVEKFIDEVRLQVKDKGIKIKVTADAINWLIEKGFDNKMGARPLQRLIDKEIKREMSRSMLFGPLKNGGMLTIGLDGDKLVQSVKPKTTKMPLLTIEPKAENVI